jgi:hypothetical protein
MNVPEKIDIKIGDARVKTFRDFCNYNFIFYHAPKPLQNKTVGWARNERRVKKYDLRGIITIMVHK